MSFILILETLHWVIVLPGISDAVYAAVQPAGQAATAEVVCGASGSYKEENHTGACHTGSGQEAQDVQLFRMEGFKNSLQTVWYQQEEFCKSATISIFT